MEKTSRALMQVCASVLMLALAAMVIVDLVTTRISLNQNAEVLALTTRKVDALLRARKDDVDLLNRMTQAINTQGKALENKQDKRK